MEDQAPYNIDRGAVASVGERLVTMAVSGDNVLMGITYRQWLIGQALAGAAVHEGVDDAAGDAVKMADAVIALIDAETARDTETADLFEQVAQGQCCGGCK